MQYFQPISSIVEEEILRKNNKTKQSIAEDVASIQTWLKTQHHLPDLLCDQQIKNYIILSRGSVEKTKQKIDMYFSMRTLFPEIFTDSNPFSNRILQAMKYIYMLPMPQLTHDHQRVLFIKLKDIDPSDIELSAIFACLMNVVDIRLFEDFCDGHLIILDLKYAKIGHAVKMTPSLIKSMYIIGEKALTTRTVGVHIINAPPFVDQVLLIVKSIVKPKLSNRIYVHKNMKSALDTLEIDILPKDVGGKEKSLDELEEQMCQKFLEYKEFFDKRDRASVDESLRPSKIYNDDILGYHGNFKSLAID